MACRLETMSPWSHRLPNKRRSCHSHDGQCHSFLPAHGSKIPTFPNSARPFRITQLIYLGLPYRDRAVYFLGESKGFGPYTDLAVAELIKQLEDPAVNGWAARGLGRVKSRADLIVPALTRCLGTNTAKNVRWIATTALMWHYENAESALPYLTNALNDPDADVRTSATNTIQQIHWAVMRSKARQP
jgi:hypothetical protein